MAYKYVAMALMLAEINSFNGKIGLPVDHPVAERDVQAGSHVGPPNTGDFSGSIVTEKYFYGFGWGHLANFHRNDFKSDSDAAVKERNVKLSKLTSLIDTNGAYQLATDWLNAMGVDLKLLEEKYKLNIVQWRYYHGEGLVGSPTMLPVFQVEWRGSPSQSSRRRRDMAVVTMTIYGPTKELVEFHILDDSLFISPRITINDHDKLLSISDAEFQVLDALQRTNLVTRFGSRQRDAEASIPAEHK